MADMILFNGVATSTPSVLSSTNDSALQPIAAAGGNILCVMGYATGGQPNTLLGPFSSPTAAAKVLRSGPLLTAVQKAFAPSTALGAPSAIYAVNVGSATAGTVSLKDASGAVALTLTTSQYGTATAGMAKVQLLAGTTLGSMIMVGYLGKPVASQDNLARVAFTIAYSGAAASANMSVTSTTILLGAPVGTTLATIDLTAVTTVAEVVDLINTVPGFQATIAPASINAQALNGLDNINGPVGAAPLNVSANLQAQIDWLNSPASGGVFSAARAATATGPAAPTATAALATGATSPAPLVSDWVSAFVMLQGKNVNLIAVLSPTPAVWAAADAHVQYMSKVGKERRAFYGPDVGTSRTAVAALPVTIDSDRSAIVWPGYYDYDANGNRTLYPPYMSAALVAAGFAALSPGQTMTNVALNVLGLETQVNVPTDTDVLIPAGVCCLAANDSGIPYVVRAISTWLASNAYDRVEVSTGMAVDFTNQGLRTTVKALLGSAGAQGQGVGPLTLSKALTNAQTWLNYCAQPAPAGPGVLVGDSNSPPWSALTASAAGDAIAISYQSSPVVPLNFITAANSLVPYTGTVTVNLPPSGSLSGTASTLS